MADLSHGAFLRRSVGQVFNWSFVLRGDSQLKASERFGALELLAFCPRDLRSFAAMAFGAGRAIHAPFSGLNFILYFIAAAIAGSLLNHNFDGGVGSSQPGYIGTFRSPTCLNLCSFFYVDQGF